jgi:hypothetical protein
MAANPAEKAQGTFNFYKKEFSSLIHYLVELFAANGSL